MKVFLLFFVLVSSVSVCRCEEFATFGDALQSATDDLVARNYDDARKDYQQALSLATTDQEKAICYFGLDSAAKRYSMARENFKRADSLANSMPDLKAMTISYIGDTFVSERKFSEAREQYSRALTLTGVSAMMQSNIQRSIGESYLTEKKFSSARIEFKKLLKLRGVIPDALSSYLFLTGKSYIQEGKYQTAREQFGQVLSIQEDDPTEKNDKLRLLNASLVRIDKQRAQIGIADSYFAEKNYAQAKIEYSNTLAMDKLNLNTKLQAQKRLKAIADLQTAKKTGSVATK